MLHVRFAVRYISLHLVNIDLANGVTVLICVCIWSVHMNIHDMLRDHLSKKVSKVILQLVLKRTYTIPLLIVLVLDNEDHVETG